MDVPSRAKELLEQALAQPPGERAGWLVRACGGDEALLAAVGGLLRQREAGSGGATPAPGPSVAGFRLVRELGRGGMGVVWLAEQERPRREVALKFLRLDSLAPGEVERFRREAEILGRLRHAGIAHVYSTGVTASELGELPWIAMEYVRGTPLGAYAVAHVPDLRGRVELVVQLCDALQHAHQQGVVHRDLKPSNVLVDEHGRVRVLDFGVARLSAGAEAPRTRTGQMFGTLAYASPEQAAGRIDEIGPSSDVYSLGVLLHELLTGELPCPVDETRLVESMQAICDEDPRRLRARRRDAPADLETVLLKALAKEPARRYADAGELAADLRRVLAEQPVRARPPTALYQARKFVRRNRALTLGTLAVFAALLLAVGVLYVGRQNERRQHARTRSMLDLMAQEVFRLVPELGFAQDHLGALEALDARLAEELALVPGDRALRGYRARTLYELAALDQLVGERSRAERRFEEARILRAELAREDPHDLESRTHLSQIYARLGELARLAGDADGELAWFQRAHELDQALVREHPGDPELIEDLGWSLERLGDLARRRGQRAETERLAQQRLADAEGLLEAEPGNWKFLYNAAQAHNVLASLEEPGSEIQAEHLRATRKLARRLLELQPRRAVFQRLLAGANQSLAQLDLRAGRAQEALSHGETAVVLGLLLFVSEPHDLDCAALLQAACTTQIDAQLELDLRAEAEATVARLRGAAAIVSETQVSGALLAAAADHMEMRLCSTSDCQAAPRERVLERYVALLSRPGVPQPAIDWIARILMSEPEMAAELCRRLQAEGEAPGEGVADLVDTLQSASDADDARDDGQDE
ncbi:MAG TPA: serine/threonine-protein kinase [Planctomycetota bacterium]